MFVARIGVRAARDLYVGVRSSALVRTAGPPGLPRSAYGVGDRPSPRVLVSAWIGALRLGVTIHGRHVLVLRLRVRGLSLPVVFRYGVSLRAATGCRLFPRTRVHDGRGASTGPLRASLLAPGTRGSSGPAPLTGGPAMRQVPFPL